MRPPKGEGTFVVHCSSAAYMAHFQAFLNYQLGLKHYALLAIPGGVQSLTLDEYLPKFPWAAWRHIKFLMDLDFPSQVVLIGHEECRWYQSGPIAHYQGPERQRQEADLRKVAANWKERFPMTTVKAFYMSIQKGAPTIDAIR